MEPEIDKRLLYERTLHTLALRARSGDAEALNLLAERLRMPLFGIAYAELRHFEDAQDAVAEALLRICLHLPDLRDPARMLPWAQGIARNEVRRIAARRRSGISLPEDIGEASSFASLLLLRLDLYDALKRLPSQQAEAARLHYLSGWSLEEIARHSERPIGTVKSWLHHARRQLSKEMEAYTPRMPTSPSATNLPTPPKREALLLQTTLAPAVISTLTDSLKAGGFTQVVVPAPEEIQAALDAVNASDFATVETWLAPYSLFVLDEMIAEQPALMYLANIKAYPTTHEIPICVLLDGPPTVFAASAYYGAGARRLVDKRDPGEWPLLEAFDAYWEKPLASFTERARRVILMAQEEARLRNDSYVSTEHLLLGIIDVPNSVGARLLTEKLSLSLAEIRVAAERLAAQGAGYDPGAVRQLTPKAVEVIDLAYDEARLLGHNYLGVEHLVLGLVRETQGLGGQILRSFGVTLERTRDLVRAEQVG